MRRSVGIPVVGGAVAAAAALVADAGRRDRLVRSGRVWWLTARRSAHWTTVKVRGARATEERRAHLEQQFAIRTAEDVAKQLGNMKGAIMKAGQMVSVIADRLPPEAQAALATLQADVPPMAPRLAEQDGLDDRHEAMCQSEIAAIYAGHPFISVPAVVPERSARRVRTSEWADGMRWEEFLTGASDKVHQRAAEVIFRFSQGSVHGHGVFN